MKVATHAGQKLITVDDFMNRLVLDRPKYVVAMADEISHVTSTDKRKLASMYRTIDWFKQMCAYKNKSNEDKWNHSDISLFGVVLPYQTCRGETKRSQEYADIVTQKISAMVNTYLDSGASGICVGGLGMGESHAVRKNAIESVRNVIKMRTNTDPVPILVQGMNSLKEILEAIDAGADMVASNYPSIVTSLGHAIDWNLHKAMDKSLESQSGRSSSSVSDSSVTGIGIEDNVINLWDAKYEEDPTPLVSTSAK